MRQWKFISLTAGFVLAAVLSPRACFSESGLTFSNTNLINSFRDAAGLYQAYDYNRFRSDLKLRTSSDMLQFHAILDFETYASRPFIKSAVYQALKETDPELPFNPYVNVFKSDDALGRIYLYRMNAAAKFDNSRFILGLQRIPFGVGRLWNPTDAFNPVDALSIETQERRGVFAANYTYHLAEFASLQLVSNLKKQAELDKYGLRYRGHHYGLDVGVSFIQNTDFLMAGVEFEANLLETGIEARGEGGFFQNNEIDENYFSGVLGLEYAFPNNITLLGEYFYNGLGTGEEAHYLPGYFINGNWNVGRHYLGMQTTYQVTPLTTVSLASICNVTDGSFFSGPSVSYSVSDETTFSIGANVFTGADTSEFGGFYDNLYYVKWESYF